MAVFTTLTSDTYHDGELGINDLGNVQPGDIIRYESGIHSVKGILGYHGTAANPIIIDLNNVESNGGAAASPILSLSNCSYIDIIGDLSNPRSLAADLHNGLTQGINTTVNCYGIRVFNVEVRDVGDTGIRTGFQTYNLSQARGNTAFGYDPYSVVMGCRVHGCGTEAIYQGASNGHVYYESGVVWYAWNWLRQAVCANNVVFDTDREGIQVNGFQDRVLVYNNNIENYGRDNGGGQSSGLQIGVGSKGYIWNNFIKDSGATDQGGGIVLSGDDIRCFNNTVINPINGVFIIDAINRANCNIELFNNTFTDIANVGISAEASERLKVKYYNNILHATTTFSSQIDSDAGLTPDSQNNTFVEGASGLSSLDFTDYANDDLTLGASSVALATGLNLKDYDSRLLLNASGEIRSLTGAWNRGAY